jgi:preprotein translocase subunit SecG
MFAALVALHVIVAVSLVLVVLLQTGRGAELGAAFGGLGQATYGRGQYTFVHKVTTALAIVFMLTSLSLAFISTERPRSSIVEPTESRPAAAEQAPATAPTAPAAPAAPAAGAAAPAAPEPTLPQKDAPPPGGSK